MKIAALIASLTLAAALQAQTTVTVDRNTGPDATPQFRFKRVPSPARGDAATKAAVALLAGTIDANGAVLAALTDDALPATEDQPSANVFFRSNSWGGRVRFDFAAPIDIAQVNSYSWHPDTRAPQVYKLFAAAGNEPGLDLSPSTKLDPARCGWKLIAFVDTRRKGVDPGGQYGVSITGPAASIGRYRYLLFDFFETESDDPWGQTFYSEIDVVAK